MRAQVLRMIAPALLSMAAMSVSAASASAQALLLASAEAATGSSAAASGDVNPSASVAKTRSADPAKAVTPTTKKTPEMLLNAHIRRGVLQIDGMVAKVRLDYDLTDAEFLYIYVPGTGTAVVSRFQSPNSYELRDAFQGNVLAFSAGGHDFRIENAQPFAMKGTGTAYVRFDTDRVAMQLGSSPMIGFGMRPQAPYAWPGALPEEKKTVADTASRAPEVPRNMLPRRISLTQTNDGAITASK